MLKIQSFNITLSKPLSFMQYGEVRIIGGQWRGRKLKFPATSGLRPTPNRVRETLFNWLSPVITDTRCLDLFAGSGALGFEALSRGAKSMTFVDESSKVIAYLQQQLKLLAAQEQAYVHKAKLHVISNTHLRLTPPWDKNRMVSCFDIVFLDPPFNKGYLEPCCNWLEQENLLTPNAYIYIEAEAALKTLPVPKHWQIMRSKTASHVSYHLFQRTYGNF